MNGEPKKAVEILVQVAQEPNADLMSMLLANLAKSRDVIIKILSWSQQAKPTVSKSSDSVLNQLLDCFVQGGEKGYNRHATYDHLAYLFADLSQVSGFHSLILQSHNEQCGKPGIYSLG